MAIEVFKRLEIKYIMTAERYKHITEFLTQYMNLDEFNQGGQFYSIANIYYDTNDHHIIRTSIAKPKYKEKLRLRAYGVPELEDKVYLEIKKKYKGIVYKRRVTMKLCEAYDFINSRQPPQENTRQFVRSQVFAELKHTLDFYKPVPMIYLAYDRIAYFGKNPEEGGPGRDLRISFDFNVRTRRSNTGLEIGDHGEQLLPENKVIMEVKSATPLPQWLLDYFAEHGMRRGSFSKYGQEYKRFVARQLNAGKSILDPEVIPGIHTEQKSAEVSAQA